MSANADANQKIIDPKILKGFRDSLPENELRKRAIIARLEHLFRSYGFVPIDTPALEYTEVLLGKGGGETDKQIFHFLDNGGRDVALRFDLTVPFARFLAAHEDSLELPFKRYHISKVWRGEKPQKGRFREFYQCDFDIVGSDNAEADFEILSMMDTSFRKLGIAHYTFCVAHRGLFNAFLNHLGLSGSSVEILREVDKLRKIGKENVKLALVTLTGNEEKTDAVLDYITRKEDESFLQTVDRLSALAGGETEHTERLHRIYGYLEESGIASHFIFDPSITRGLDYYTGIVYETFLDDLPSFGSVCSGGRYNNLASLYTKTKLPGVGSSIGLDRLLSALEELKLPQLNDTVSADAIIFNKDSALFGYGTSIASALREKGIRVDTYLLGKKMPQQFKYAEANHIPFGIFLSEADKQQHTLCLRDLRDRSQFDSITVSKACEVIGKVRQ
ncbi:MAG: histidine--tRNA ligase [Spirochaetia bacterium]|jgi:histidyl-tRNA synthetase|nr:histidine--tRNA ligase [Spirochaetia bacterium]